MKDLESLVSLVSNEITEKHIKDGSYARHLNVSLAFFIHDALSLMDRGFVFSLIKCYLKKVCGCTGKREREREKGQKERERDTGRGERERDRVREGE